MILAFGQLLKLLVQTGMISIGVVLMISGLKKTKNPNLVLKSAGRLKFAIGTGLVVPVLILIGVEAYFEGNTEWDPIIRSDEQILGTYAGSGMQLTLLPGRKCVFFDGRGGHELKGDWHLDDCNLTLSAGGRARDFRVIIFRGNYRLRAESLVRDPDEIGWWEIGMRRISTNPTNSVSFQHVR